MTSVCYKLNEDFNLKEVLSSVGKWKRGKSSTFMQAVMSGRAKTVCVAATVERQSVLLRQLRNDRSVQGM